LPHCSAELEHVQFPTAGLRFLVVQPHRSLNDVLLDMAEPHGPDLVCLLRAAPETLDVDSFDKIEMRVELLEELERHLPELAD
jgi:hypothetical protein